MKDLNFFSPYIKVNKSSKIKKTYVFITVISLALIFGGAHFWTIYRMNNIEKNITEMEDFLKSNDVVDDIKNLNEKKREVEIMNKYYDLALIINEDMESVDRLGTGILSKITNALPEDITFDMISMDINNIQIQGISRSRVSIAELQHNLKNSNIFSKVYVIDISKASKEIDRFVFALKCTLKDVN
ncbi:MAG: PilN domain-containing protein [Firmicutes bacterium]|nr:PilN domain-containing protein [Bacillota bacterium]